MPVGNQYQFGPFSAGPAYPENLPFGLGSFFTGDVNNPVSKVNLTPDLSSFFNGPGLSNSPAMQDLKGSVSWDWPNSPLNQALSYFGLTKAPPTTPAQTADVTAPQQPGLSPTGPMDDFLSSIFQGHTFNVGKFPGRRALPKPDMSGVETELAAALPHGAGMLTPEDKLLYTLGAIGDAGYDPKQGMGQNLLRMALAGMGGGLKYRTGQREEQKQLEEEQSRYHLGAAETKAREQEMLYNAALQDASQGNEWNLKRFELGMPHAEGGMMFHYDPTTGQAEATRMMDPMTMMMLSAMRGAGGAITPGSPSKTLLEGAGVPDSVFGGPQKATAFKVALQDQREKFYQEAMKSQTQMGVKPDTGYIQEYADRKLDAWLAQNFPQIYQSAQMVEQNRGMFNIFSRGLEGKGQGAAANQ